MRLTVLEVRRTVLGVKLTVLGVRLTVLGVRLTVLGVRLTVLGMLAVLGMGLGVSRLYFVSCSSADQTHTRASIVATWTTSGWLERPWGLLWRKIC